MADEEEEDEEEILTSIYLAYGCNRLIIRPDGFSPLAIIYIPHHSLTTLLSEASIICHYRTLSRLLILLHELSPTYVAVDGLE